MADARTLEWKFKTPIQLHDAKIPRMGCVDPVDGLPLYMVDAEFVWREIRQIDATVAAAEFAAGHRAGEDFLYVEFNNFGRVLSSVERLAESQSMFISVNHLHGLLHLDGKPFPIQPRAAIVAATLRDALGGSSAGSEMQPVESSELLPSHSTAPPMEVPDMSHSEVSTTGGVHVYATLNRRGRVRFGFVLTFVTLGCTAVLTALILDWTSTAQKSIEQPANLYLTSLTNRSTFASAVLISTARGSVNAISYVGTANGLISDLNVAHVVNSVTTSKVILSPQQLIRFLVGILRSSEVQAWVGVALEDGSMYSATYIVDGSIRLGIRDSQNVLGNGGCFSSYQLADLYSANFSTNRTIDCSYDPLAQEWYSSTKSSQLPGWSSVYSDPITGRLMMGATEPLFVNSNSSESFIGVITANFFVDTLLALISEVKPGRSGAVFITEHKNDDYYLIAASSQLDPTFLANVPNVSAAAQAECGCGGIYTQLTVQQARPKEIVDAFELMKGRHGEASLRARDLTFLGEASSDSPMVKLTQLVDRHGLEWQVWCTIPAVDYYGFIQTSNVKAIIVALALIGLVFFVVVRKACSAMKQYNGMRLTSLWALRGLAVVFMITTGLYVYLLSATQQGVNEVAADGLIDTAARFQDSNMIAIVFAQKTVNVSAVLADSGFIDIVNGDPSKDTSLDKTCVEVLLTIGRLGPLAVHSFRMGFENAGSMLGAVHYDNSQLIMVRNADTFGDLVFYGTKGSGRNLTRDVTNEVGRISSYNPKTSVWYTSALTQSRLAGSNFAIDGITWPYFMEDNGLRLSVVQPYWADISSAAPSGVLSMEVEGNYMTADLLALRPSSDSSMSVVSNLGEIIGRDNGDLITVGSAGRSHVINSTSIGDDLSTVTLKALKEHPREIEKSQGDKELRGAKITSLTSAASFRFGSGFGVFEMMKHWTLVQIVPRDYYYSDYDESTDRTFSTLLFMAAALFYFAVKSFASLQRRLIRALSRREVVQAVKQHSHIHSSQRLSRRNSVLGSTTVLEGVESLRDGVELEKLNADDVPSPTKDPLLEDPRTAVNASVPEPVPEAPTEKPDKVESECHEELCEGQVIPSKDKSVQFVVCHVDDTGQVIPSVQQQAEEELTTKMVERFNCLFRKDPLNCTDEELLEKTREALERLVDRWRHLPEPELQQKLKDKAVDYLVLITAHIAVPDIAGIESRYGEDTRKLKVYKLIRGFWFRQVIATMIFLMLLVELLPDNTTKKLVDVAVVLVVSFDVLFQTLGEYWANHMMKGSRVAHAGIVLLLWVTVGLSFANDSMNLTGFVKPLVVLTKMQEIRAAFQVFVWAILEARAVFAIFFIMLVQAAVMMLLLFRDRYPPSQVLGTTADTFTDSFVAMFVFITSGENWDQVVYPMYEWSKSSAIFFLCLVVIGLFFLSSLVIATFEATYDKRKSTISEASERQKFAALCYAFVLATWNTLEVRNRVNSAHDVCMSEESFVELIRNYWTHQSTRHVYESSLLNLKLSTVTNSLRKAVRGYGSPQEPAERSDTKSQMLNNIECLLAKTIFQTMDADDNQTVELREFQEVFIVASCVEMIKRDSLLAHRVIAARWELELMQATNEELKDDLVRFLKKARHNVTETINNIEKKRRVFGKLSWREIDRYLIVCLIAHAYVLSQFGTEFGDRRIYNISCIITNVYVAEIMLRVVMCGGLNSFLNDSLYPHSAWANSAQFLLVMTCLVFEIAYFVLPAEASFVCQGVMALGLYRLLFISKSFVCLLHCFWHGLMPLKVYVQLFAVVYYLFSFAAWQLFQGELELEYSNFNTMGDSMLLMFQIFVGEGWHSVMQLTVEETNKAYVYFFMVYVLIVGILFSNLFIGIIIQTFQQAQSDRSTSRGELDLVFWKYTSGMADPRRLNLYKELGHLASLLYAPVMQSLDGLYTLGHRYSDEIQHNFGGDVELWAVVTIQNSFQKRRANLLKKFLRATKRVLTRVAQEQSEMLFVYEDVYKACELCWGRIEQIEPEHWDASLQAATEAAGPTLAVGVMQQLGLFEPFGYFPFQQSMFIRRWDFHTFMSWVTPQVVSVFDESAGFELWDAVPRPERTSAPRIASEPATDSAQTPPQSATPTQPSPQMQPQMQDSVLPNKFVDVSPKGSAAFVSAHSLEPAAEESEHEQQL